MRGRARAAAGTAIVAMLAGALVAVAAGPAAGALDNNVEVEKVVVGTAPVGTVFTIHYDCGTSSGDLTYDAVGTPISPLSGSFSAPPVGTCTINETGTGSASGVNYVCNAHGNVTVACNGTGTTVTFTGPATPPAATFTVINAYLGTPTLSPTTAAPGQQVTVSGTGCTKALFGGHASTGGSIVVNVGFTPPIVLNTTAVGGTGAWSVTFTVPSTVANGSYAVHAICDDPVPYPALTLAVQAAAAATPISAAPTFAG